MEPLLQVKNIAKEFPGVKALEDISIDFYRVNAMLWSGKTEPENLR